MRTEEQQFYDIAEKIVRKRNRTLEFRYWPDCMERYGIQTAVGRHSWRLVELIDGEHVNGCYVIIAEDRISALSLYIQNFVEEACLTAP